MTEARMCRLCSSEKRSEKATTRFLGVSMCMKHFIELSDNSSEFHEPIIEKKKRTSIPKKVRLDVWAIHCGKNNIEGKCLCCKCIVRQDDFECSHFVSVKNGGTDDIDNLRICCKGCNRGMGSKNIDDFMKKYGYDKISLVVKEKRKFDRMKSSHILLLFFIRDLILLFIIGWINIK
jgi:5-methylcytosine-specific restriction endonuclease McrA